MDQDAVRQSRSSPTRSSRQFVLLKVAQCSLLTLELFNFLGGEEVAPSDLPFDRRSS
jgi:hypothetical protein